MSALLELMGTFLGEERIYIGYVTVGVTFELWHHPSDMGWGNNAEVQFAFFLLDGHGSFLLQFPLKAECSAAYSCPSDTCERRGNAYIGDSLGLAV